MKWPLFCNSDTCLILNLKALLVNHLFFFLKDHYNFHVHAQNLGFVFSDNEASRKTLKPHMAGCVVCELIVVTLETYSVNFSSKVFLGPWYVTTLLVKEKAQAV